MKKATIIKSLILVIAVVLNVIIIQKMHKKQNEINADRSKISKLPLASFHKFWADVKWMMFIQHLGSIDLTTDKNSKDLYDEATAIIDLDPGFYKAYEMSGLMLSARTPDYAIDLLEKGQKAQNLKDNSKLFYMAGNIRHQETFFNKKVDIMEKLHDATRYYREALSKSDTVQILEKTYVKSKAQLAHEASKKAVKEATPEEIKSGSKKVLHLLIAELIEWESYLNEKSVDSEMMMEDDSMMMSINEDTKKDILSLIQRIRNNPKTRDDKTGKQISQKLLKSMFENIHVCGRCYSPYAAGHKFCSTCSASVKIYGVCKNTNCMKVHGGGAYCEYCGTPTPKKSKDNKKK